MSGEGEQFTGVSDSVYNLSSVLYHAAEGGTLYAKYIEDAEREDDRALADFFRKVQQQDAERAQEAKALLVDPRGLSTEELVAELERRGIR